MTHKTAIVAFTFGVSMLAATSLEAGQCTIATTSVVFGTYNVFHTAPVDSTGTLQFNCTGGAKNVQVVISRGSGTFAQRTLRRGAEALGYNFFLDAARTSIWGDGSGGSQAYFVGNPPNNRDVVVAIYGRIPAGQDISAGAYADSVTVTVNF